MIDVPSALQVGDARVHRRRPARRRADDGGRHPARSRRTSARSRSRSASRTISSPTRCARSGSGRTTTRASSPARPPGLLLDPSQYYDTGLASTAIGYGVAVTGMQMLDAYATIANGGVTRPPHLLDATIDAEGHAAPGDGRPRAAASCRRTPRPRCRRCSTGVVSAGTGACAAIPGYTIAGKTGTARKAVNGGYSDGTMASFIGYAPAAHPQLAAIVVLDEPDEQLRRRRGRAGVLRRDAVRADALRRRARRRREHAVQRGARVGRGVGHRRASIPRRRPRRSATAAPQRAARRPRRRRPPRRRPGTAPDRRRRGRPTTGATDDRRPTPADGYRRRRGHRATARRTVRTATPGSLPADTSQSG